MKDEKKEKKNPWRFLFLLAAVVGAWELVGGLLAKILYWVQLSSVSGAPGAASIGIIGGADGPTAIFVTYSVPSWLKLAGALLLLGVGIYGYLRLKRGKQKEE